MLTKSKPSNEDFAKMSTMLRTSSTTTAEMAKILDKLDVDRLDRRGWALRRMIAEDPRADATILGVLSTHLIKEGATYFGYRTLIIALSQLEDTGNRPEWAIARGVFEFESFYEYFLEQIGESPKTRTQIIEGIESFESDREEVVKKLVDSAKVLSNDYSVEKPFLIFERFNNEINRYLEERKAQQN